MDNKDIFKQERCSKGRVSVVLVILLSIISCVLFGLLIYEWSQDDEVVAQRKDNNGLGVSIPDCGASSARNDLSEPKDPDVFHDLTTLEMRVIRAYLEATINLEKPKDVGLRDPHIYTMWLELPSKAQVLAHLDSNAPQPDRYARVMLFRGDLVPPVVQEMVCGPLVGNISCSVDSTFPFAHRPVEYTEYDAYEVAVIPEIHRRFGHILRESYDGSFDYDNCEDDCFNYWCMPVGSGTFGSGDVRRLWILPMFYQDYYSLFSVDFAVLLNVDGVDASQFHVEQVWYSGELFTDLDDFVASYNVSKINKTKIARPTNKTYGSLKPQDTSDRTNLQRPPELVEPDGKRYTVQHRKIEYLGMWAFHYRIHPITGPAFYDVRFNGERIAYEISWMEIAVQYAGNIPAMYYHVIDSAYIYGSGSRSLVTSVDCPPTATYLPKIVTSQGREEPVTFPRATCVFEQNLGRPLRRHTSYSVDDGTFYGGMQDSALVVRSIHTIDNYDYIIDLTFHQNGALGVSVVASGYILSSFYSPSEMPYGVKLADFITGPVHIHAAHFKVDLDISGTFNRYETLDIEEEKVQHRMGSKTATVSQFKFTENLKKSEKEAALKYNFEQPKYHIFHNDAVRNQHGEKKSYRLVNRGMAKLLLQEGNGNEEALTWARYQLAVTKYKDNETMSSKPYLQFGTANPAVRFQDFIDDDENLEDEDLVAWVTLGFQHIPHTEDLPVTPTAGKEVSFYLHPYNYFPTCPSSKSSDHVYMEHLDEEDPAKGIKFIYPGSQEYGDSLPKCVHTAANMSEPWADNPDLIFETTENHGVTAG